MSTSWSSTTNYYLSGSLPADDPTYVVRQADDDLYLALRKGIYSYVLAARQMGKSSLRVRMIERLKAHGVTGANVDLLGITSAGITPEDWYFGILYKLASTHGICKYEGLQSWWSSHGSLSPAQRLVHFIDTVLLEEVQGQIVIFVDEIDCISRISFGDDFVGLIRYLHDMRVERTKFKRLAFVLLGVADTSNLIKDKSRAPFNIGQAVSLNGFTLEEARPVLASGLSHKFVNPDKLLREILSWTGGQPFLTQKVCDLASNTASSPKIGQESEWVADLVRSRIIDNWEAQDNPIHLRPIRDRILVTSGNRTGRLLGLYQQILREGGVQVYDSPEQTELRLSGLVVERGSSLEVCNRIYESVFDLHWVETRLSELRPYSESLAQWLASNRQDESWLLRGQALESARQWAQGKRLSDDDYEFLAACEKQEANRRLAEERMEVQRRRVKIFRVAAIVAIGVGFTMAILAMTAYIERGAAQSATDQANRLRVDAVNKGNEKQQLLELVNRVDLMVPYTKAVLRGHQKGLTAIAFNPDGRQLVTATEDGSVWLWESEHGLKEDVLSQSGSPVTALSFSHDGRSVLVAYGDGSVEICDLAKKIKAKLGGHAKSITSAVFSRDDSLIVTASEDGTARLWRAASGELLRILSGHKGTINEARFNANGDKVLTAGADGTARIWSVGTDSPGIVLTGHRGSVNAIDETNDGRFIVTASRDGTARIWDARAPHRPPITLHHRDGVNDISLSRDGTLAVSACADWTARVWALPSGRQLSVLREHSGRVLSAVFSPDGRKVLTASEDRTARVWDARRGGAALATLGAHAGAVIAATFGSGGSLIATASADGTARVWDATEIGGVKVRDAFIQAAPDSYVGPCPVPVSFTARLTITGGPGSVSYRFIRSDGHTTQQTPLKLLKFETPGIKYVGNTWKIGMRPNPEFSGSEAIEILSPNHFLSESARFKVSCQSEPKDTNGEKR